MTGLLAGIRSICILKPQRTLCITFSWQDNYFIRLRVFHTIVRWQSFTGIWVSKSPSSCRNPFVTILTALITIGNLFFVFFQFYSMFSRDSKVHNSARYYYYFLTRVFHIIFSWWSFPGVWVTASLLKSPGLFSVFWPFSIMLSFGWSPLGRHLSSPPVPLIILKLFYQKYQSQLV